MLFIVRWNIPQVSRKTAIQPFLETGGALPAVAREPQAGLAR